MHPWLSRDPIGYAGGINLYSYAGNNPVNGVDPWGLAYELPDPFDDSPSADAQYISEAGIYHPIIHEIGCRGQDVLDFAGSFNPLINFGTAAFGQNGSGRPANGTDRFWAAAAIIPFEGLINGAGKTGWAIRELSEAERVGLLDGRLNTYLHATSPSGSIYHLLGNVEHQAGGLSLIKEGHLIAEDGSKLGGGFRSLLEALRQHWGADAVAFAETERWVYPRSGGRKKLEKVPGLIWDGLRLRPY